MLHTTNFMDTYHIELLKLVEHICLIVIKGHLVKNAAIRSHLLESESKYVSLKSVTQVYTILGDNSTWFWQLLPPIWSVKGEAGDAARPGELAGDRLCDTGLGGALLAQFVPSPGLFVR